MTHPRHFRDDDPVLARIREICLVLPDADEKVSHGRPAFFTTKVFAYFGGSVKVDGEYVQHDQCVMVLPDESDRQALLEDPRVFVPAYLGPSGWIGVDLAGAEAETGWDEVAELIDASYRLTAGTRRVALLDQACCRMVRRDVTADHPEQLVRSRNPWIAAVAKRMVRDNEVGGLPMTAPQVERNDSWDVHDAFDAEVGVTVAETGLYLVAAHDEADGANAMRRTLRAVGAQLIAGMSDRKVLAVMTFSGFQTLRADPAVRLIGPVALDTERFSHFQRLIGARTDN